MGFLFIGERLKLPDNVHIFFEVDNLLHATPATITRCGMLHVDGGTISHAMRISRLISQLREVCHDCSEHSTDF